MNIDEVIKQYPTNVPIPVVAQLLGKSVGYVYTGLQHGRLPFGSAVKPSLEWSYHVPPLALKAYLEGERVMTTPEVISRVVEMTVAKLQEEQLEQEAGA